MQVSSYNLKGNCQSMNWLKRFIYHLLHIVETETSYNSNGIPNLPILVIRIVILSTHPTEALDSTCTRLIYFLGTPAEHLRQTRSSTILNRIKRQITSAVPNKHYTLQGS